MSNISPLIHPGFVISCPLGSNIFALGLVTHIDKKNVCALTTFPLVAYEQIALNQFQIDLQYRECHRELHSLLGIRKCGTWQIIATNMEVPEGLRSMPYFFTEGYGYIRKDDVDPLISVCKINEPPKGAQIVEEGMSGHSYIESVLRLKILGE